MRERSWESHREALIRVTRRASHGIRLCKHTDGDGPEIFRHACAMGLEGHRLKAARCALPLRALLVLDQGQEPERAGGNAQLRMRVIARTWRRGPVLEVELTCRRRGRIVLGRPIAAIRTPVCCNAQHSSYSKMW